MRICFLGDSFVNGTGDPEGLGWVGRVCASARRGGRDITAYNLGIRRDTSALVAARWRDEAERRLPPGVERRLVFSFGVNDCTLDEATGRPRLALAESLAHAGAILSAARNWLPTVMVGPPPIDDEDCNARVAPLSLALGELCAGLGVPFLPVFAPLSADPVWRHEIARGDGAHPGAAGYGVLAALVEDWGAVTAPELTSIK